MATITHPNRGTGGDAPTQTTELVIDVFIPPIIPSAGARLRHPEPSLLDSGTGGDAAVGYAS